MASYMQWISLLASSFLLQRVPIVNVPPTVTLDGATFQGTSSLGITRFLGIPFAEPPTGESGLRFHLPVPVTYAEGTFNATDFGPACPQQATQPFPTDLPAELIDFLKLIFNNKLPDSEDCLTINVVRPTTIAAGKKLPVVVWIYGGGFQLGGSSINDGGPIVRGSMNMGQPMIYVSMNFRQSLFGFLASQDVKDAGVGNLGLHDQREALRWIQKYIGQFGGDPSQVTIWGQSSGAMSVSLQMLTNGGNTEGLFRAAYMQSGAPIAVGDITHGQKYYDAVVEEVGCSSALNKLECLRTVDYALLYEAMNNSPSVLSYQSLMLAWLPRVDGVFLTDNPQTLVASGSVANIPIVVGSCDDEGTLFSLYNRNVTTEDEMREYLKTNYLLDATDDEITELLQAYPANVTEGSPYGTEQENVLTPQYKRLASFQGDAVFQAPRRYFINQLAEAGKKDIWVFLSQRFKSQEFLGSFHGSDLLNVYDVTGIGKMRNYLVSFVNNLDPNHSSGFSWPQWTQQARDIQVFQVGLVIELGNDTYRNVSVWEKVSDDVDVGFIGTDERFDKTHVEVPHMILCEISPRSTFLTKLGCVHVLYMTCDFQVAYIKTQRDQLTQNVPCTSRSLLLSIITQQELEKILSLDCAKTDILLSNLSLDTGMETDHQIKLGKEFGPAGLPPCKEFGS